MAAFVLRLVVMTIAAAVLAGATLTLAAERTKAPQSTIVPVAPAPAKVTVPDVTGQAYVFAKGILQDHGFAWHVTGPVQGYAANVVASQQPNAGTSVIDTGAPTIGLTLQRNPSYIERGTPDNDAPYRGTAIQFPSGAVQTRPAFTPRLEPVAIPQAPPTTPKQTVTAPAPAATPATTPVTTPTTTPTTLPTTPVTTAATTATTPTPTPATPTPTSTTPLSPAPRPGQPRTPDFVVPGAPKEPRRVQPLPSRAQALAAWLEQHRQPTAANLNYWLYDHAYIVAGAKFGWWHGAEALQTLIIVDQRAEVLWGVGKQSELTAQSALAEVSARNR